MSENYPRKNLYLSKISVGSPQDLRRISTRSPQDHWVCDGAVGEMVEVLSFRTAVRGGGMHFVHD